MIDALPGLAVDADHRDISYRNEAGWPMLTEKGSLRAFIFDIGDKDAGPNIQLGLIQRRDDEPLDWKHSIDPLHHHGSDQFRAIMGGEWSLGGRRLKGGDFSFQESGIVYQEHPVADEVWMMLVMGDRRGNLPTLGLKKDEDTMFQFGDTYTILSDETAYPHPAGNRGIAAVATSEGPCTNGFLSLPAEGLAPGQTVSGLFGDEIAGPAVHVMRLEPGAMAMPASRWGTELILAVPEGSVTVGGDIYGSGELRIQRADTPLGAIVAGDAGAELVILRADRRGAPDFGGQARPNWLPEADRLRSGLRPRPGGPSARAA